MKNLSLIFYLFLVLSLLLPIQNIQAAWWDDALKETLSTISGFNKILPELIEQFENGELDAAQIEFIVQGLNAIYNYNASEFFRYLLEYPQLKIILDTYFNDRINQDLEKISPELIELGVDSYLSSVAKNIQSLGEKQIQVVYADQLEIDRLEKNQGFINESVIIGAKSIFIYELETGKIITLDEAAKKFVNQNPLLKDSDFGKDPIRAGLMLFFDGQYLFVAPIIPISENQLISLEEFCRLEIDSELCEKAKTYLKLATMASKAKDPTLFIPAANAFLSIIKEINNETNAGLDDELNYADELFSINPKHLANAKLIRTQDNQYVSLNEATSLGFDENKISIAISILNYMSTDEKQTAKQLESDLIMVISIIDELNN